jgi:ABC-type transport system involved in cytochrome c biogenesis permease subunit
MSALTRFAPWLSALLGVAWFGVAAMPSRISPGDFDLAAFGTIPVVDGGRLKPLDTVARTDLMVISAGRQTYKSVPYGEDGGTNLPAIKWLLDVWSNQTPFDGPGTKHQVIRVENDQLLNLFDLKLRPEFYRYSPAELHKGYGRFEREYKRVEDMDAKSRDPFEQMVFEVGRRLALYEVLVRRRSPLVVPPANDKEDWRSLASIDEQATGSLAEQVRDQLANGLLARLREQKIDPARLGEDQRNELLLAMDKEITRRVREAAAAKRASISPAAAAFSEIIDLYAKGDAPGFNRAVADYKVKYVGEVSPGDARAVNFEASFNRFDPFFHCQWLYVLVFALGCLSWVGGPFGSRCRWSAVGLALVTLTVHSAALIGRMYIQGRPPITNLYSSAVYIAWGCLATTLILELIYQNGIGIALGGLTGFLSLQIADRLGTSGDTLEMMQAVLDTNFWLATHVTIVTSGYFATYIAGFLGAVFIFLGVFTRKLDTGMLKVVAQMIYGVICFATLLSFVGTVLGGIWADQSWGRFWGWDPKENGALLVVIWNALGLHARWSGMVKQRGLAVLAVLGNIVATWSWFGTNQLGVGLHAYGFRNDIAFWVVTSSAIFLTVAAIGIVPLRYWRSFATSAAGGTQQLRPKGTRQKPVPARV